MEVLVQFIKDNRMRLTDVFFRFDKDRNDQITKSELIKGLMSSGLKMNKVYQKIIRSFYHLSRF